MSKLERLLNLTAALLERRRPMTAEEIHEVIPGYPERFESFRRSFERDKDDLREMGIPIEVVELIETNPPQVGYVIRPDRYYLADPHLSTDELAALRAASLAIRIGEGAAESDAIRKLGGVDPSAHDIAADTVEIPQPLHLEDLFAAISERRVVEFRYQGEDRTLQPHRLDFHRGRWYVGGYDVTRQAERRFRLDRFESECHLGAPGAFPKPSSPAGQMSQPWELGEGEPVVARLLIDADHAPVARQQFPPDTPWETRPDGSAIATVTVLHPAGFRNLVLTFLDHAEILEPPSLREDLVSWLTPLVGAP